MAFTRHHHPKLGFVLTRLTGALTDANLIDSVEAFNRDVASRKAQKELSDCRDVEDLSGLTVEGTAAAARREQGQPRAVGGRLAILVAERPLDFGMARSYASIAGLSRADTHVSRSLRECVSWLGYEGEDAEEAIRFVEETRAHARILGGVEPQ